MKRVIFAIMMIVFLFAVCSCDGIGMEQPIVTTEVTTEVIDTTPPPYDPTASPIELSPDEEIEIIRNFILYSSSTKSENDYKVRCFGAENGAYAVFVEPVGYTPIEFEDYLEKPYSTPVTREYFGSSEFDFWYEIGDPLIIYKDGEFYRLRNALETGIVTGAFLSEVNDRYKAANPGFYDNNTNYGYGY
ncbi:MAG: hypothetical protein J6S71_07145 [Clostridia bacterium]|nr:hypothetical protein [Clostridia bacterium]